MYTKEEAAKKKQEFWTKLGQYLSPLRSVNGQKVNWVNYKTGFRALYFRMDVDRERAYIGIVMQQKDADLRELFFEQLMELKAFLHATVEEEWTWDPKSTNAAGMPQAYIYTTLEGVNVFRESDWPSIITFLKQRIVALDEFWEMGQEHLAPLKSFG